ncbi:hypothetical protein JCM33374_g1595 [Metschnikowia sp. JCM 33374]|nr:hypothetical protein JCM33374_g1595 [Metschnikowia sp. JCM 33374]
MAPKTNVAEKTTSNSKPSSLSENILRLAKTSQVYWFAAHAASIVCFAVWQLVGFFSRASAQRYSRLTLFFQLVSYGVVIWKSVPVAKTKNKIQLLRNENVQYFAFAAVLLLCSIKLIPWTKPVLPFIVYSFFHAITYFQKNLLEHLPVSLHTQAAINDRITFISSNYNLQALYFASLSELSLLIDIILGIPGLLFYIFRDPVYVAFFVFRSLAVLVFLKLRYDESQYTRQAVQQLDARIGGVLANPMVPAQLRDLYYGPVKNAISNYAGLVSVPKIASAKKSQ